MLEKKESLTLNRGIRLVLLTTKEQKEELIEFQRRMTLLINYASKQLFYLFPQQPNLFEEIQSIDGNILISFSEMTLRKYDGLDQKRLKLGLHLTRMARTAAGMAGKFYNGFGQRNGENGTPDEELQTVYEYAETKSPPSTSNFKAIHLCDGIVKMPLKEDHLTFSDNVVNGLVECTNAHLRFTVSNKKVLYIKFAVPINHLKNLKYYNTSKPEIYGNLVLNKRFNRDGSINFKKSTYHIMVMANVEKEYSYHPKTALGIDLNATEEIFVTLSDGSFIPRGEDITNKLKQIKDIQKTIKYSFGKDNPNFIKSKQRRLLRLEWKRIHKEVEKLLEECADSIIEKGEREKALFCVDNVAISNKVSFGHSELKKVLIKKLESQRLPFVLVRASHTSSDCNVCLNTRNKYVPIARKGRIISCPVCEKNYDADVNAAQNIRDDGIQIWNTGKLKRPTKKQRSTKKVKFLDYNEVNLNDLTLDKDIIF